MPRFVVCLILFFETKKKLKINSFSEDQGAKPKTSDETVEKIDDFEGQINNCLDGLLEKG